MSIKQVSHGDIGWAVEQMRNGDKVCRHGWNGKNMWLRMRGAVAATEQMGENYESFIEIMTVQNLLVPWLCSQTDLLATDWELVE